MRINNVDYGRIWAASGALGVFGEGYWFHKVDKLLIPGFTTNGITFVAKTTTNHELAGNMPLRENWQPREWFPRCIWFDFWKGVGLNAVGLSNYGMKAALETNQWQQRDEPYMLSWMPTVGKDPLEEARWFVENTGIKSGLYHSTSPFALQVNLSCPNTGEDLAELTKETVDILKILEELNIPLLPKFNVLTAPEAVADIADKARVDGVVMSNTIPFGTRELGLHWSSLVGAEESPLTRRGLQQPGGLSGTVLFPIVRNWVRKAAKPLAGIPISFCGGVDSATRVQEALSLPNVESVSVGTAFMLRPWRLRSMIRAAQQ